MEMVHLTKPKFEKQTKVAIEKAFQVALKYYPDITQNEGILFYLPQIDDRYDYDKEKNTFSIPKQAIIKQPELSDFLFNKKTNKFRRWVNIHPIGKFKNKPVFEIKWSDAWVAEIAKDSLSYGEPFLIGGPFLDGLSDKFEKLKIIKETNDDFEWLIPLSQADGLHSADFKVRADTITKLYRKRKGGLSEELIVDKIKKTADIESNREVVLRFIEYFSLSPNTHYESIIKKWTSYNDRDVMKDAFMALTCWPSDENFSYICGSATKSLSIRNLLIKAALLCIKGSNERLVLFDEIIKPSWLNRGNKRLFKNIKKDLNSG